MGSLPVFFADDSKRNVDRVRETCGLADEQVMHVDKDEAIGQSARAVISTFFSKRLSKKRQGVRLQSGLGHAHTTASTASTATLCEQALPDADTHQESVPQLRHGGGAPS